MAFRNPLDTDVDRPDVKIGTLIPSKEGLEKVYAGPKYGDVTQEKYNELLNSGALGYGQQAVELTGQQISEHLGGIASNIGETWEEKVGGYIPDIEPNESVQNAFSLASKILGKGYEWGVKPTVDATMNIIDAPATAIAWTSRKLDPSGRGIGKAPIAIAETAVTMGGGTLKNIGKKVVRQGDEAFVAANKILKGNQLQPAYGAVGDVGTVTRNVDELPPGTMYASTANRADYSRTVTDRSIVNNPIKQKEVKLDYLDKKNMKVINIAGEDVLVARTATHHMKGLADSANPITLHNKGKQILKELKADGLVLGEHPGNYIALGETITQASRKFRVESIKKLYPNIPEKSIKDALRQSIFDKDKWLFNSKELAALEEWRALTLNAPPGSIVKTPKNIKHILNKTGDFPTIELIAKDGSKIKWKPKTFKEYFNRWNKIGEHYGVKIDAKKIKGIKIDPNLDILGKDHGHVHDMLKQLPSNIELNNLIKSGKWQKLSVPEAKRVYAAAMNDQYKVAINMAEYRYNKISEYFKKFDPQSRDFASLPLAEQSKYFKDNIEKLVSRGSFKELPDLEYLTKDTNVLPGMKVIFGIQ